MSHPAQFDSAGQIIQDFTKWLESGNHSAFVNYYVNLSPTKSVKISMATKMFQSDDKEGDVRLYSLLLVFFNYGKLTTVRESGGLSWKQTTNKKNKKNYVMRIKLGQSHPYLLQSNYSWSIYKEKVNRSESVGHIRIYQHLQGPYSRLPAIHLALSSPDPVCFPSVWPIVTESNCRQKTTSNDYFICTSEPESVIQWKVTDRYFQQKNKAPFLFPTHNFRQQRILLTWLRLEHQNKWQSAVRGQSAQRGKKDHWNNLVPATGVFLSTTD